MEVKELMVDDWVYNKRHKKNIQITPYDFFTHGHLPSGRQYFIGEPEVVSGRDLEPIPLTQEILEKNGFEDWDGWSIYSPENTGIEIAWLGTILKIGGECGNFELPAIEYIHQLQHALRLCGIDKTIEL